MRVTNKLYSVVNRLRSCDAFVGFWDYDVIVPSVWVCRSLSMFRNMHLQWSFYTALLLLFHPPFYSFSTLQIFPFRVVTAQANGFINL